MKKNIPIFVTHYGCPNQCVFCNQKKISGIQNALDFDACQKILEDASKKGYAPEHTEVAFFGGSFTGIPMEHQRAYLELAQKYQEFFHGIRLSTRPDYITTSILDMLKNYGVTTIELGVQSMIDEVLKKNQRGMTKQDTIHAVELIRNYPFSLGLQMMVSMYGSSPEDDLQTADLIIGLQPDFVRIYPTVVLEDTTLYDLYQSGDYQTKSLEETVQLTAEIYRKFLGANISVIRVGLMASDEINSKKIIGAYHEAFGELVQNEVYFQLVTERLTTVETAGKTLLIFCCRKDISKVLGHKKRNVTRLKEQFYFQNIQLIPDSSKETFEFSLEVQS